MKQTLVALNYCVLSRSQHADTLRQLHSEIERLKLENKGMPINAVASLTEVNCVAELNFKLVMCRCEVSCELIYLMGSK